MKKMKPGDMVQIWDWQSGGSQLDLHGKVGYLVKQFNKKTCSAIWEVIFFDQPQPTRQFINSEWIVKIDRPDDIKKKT